MKVTLRDIALALKKGYVPGKIILGWIRDYRINAVVDNLRLCPNTMIMLHDFEQQAKELSERQRVRRIVKEIRKDWYGK